MSVLLISDNLEFGGIWTYALRQRGLEAAHARTGQEAGKRLQEDSYALVIIDIYAQEQDSIALCQQVRPQTTSPVLLLTSRGDEGYVLAAYEAGVDECIVKPLSPSLFLAKIAVWLRHSRTGAGSQETKGPLAFRLDSVRRQVIRADGTVVRLTYLECRVLQLLLTHTNQVLDSGHIIDVVWGYRGDVDGALLKNVVYRLRNKIEPDPHRPTYIQTVPGEGYLFSG